MTGRIRRRRLVAQRKPIEEATAAELVAAAEAGAISWLDVRDETHRRAGHHYARLRAQFQETDR